MFYITGVPYKRLVNYDFAKDWGMATSFPQPEVPYKGVPYKRTLLY